MSAFHFELVSPTRLLFSAEVDQVDVPGSEGDFGVLAGHAPFITTLKPGILTIKEGGGVRQLYVRDGFAEVNPSGLTILTEYAVPVEELAAGQMAEEITAAEEHVAEAKDGAARDKAAERVDRLKQVAAQLGSVKAPAH
jgi:F-type H+-transporting ATPase subunit epsilon